MKKIKILAVRNDRFGEFLLNIPALRALKREFSTATLSLAVNPYNAELAARIDAIDEVIVWENRKHRFMEVLRFARQLRKKGFDLCIIFNPSKEINLLSFLSGIPLRVGYDRKWGFLLNRRIKDTKYLGAKHEIDYNLDLARLAGAESCDRAISLKISPDEARGLLSGVAGQPLVAVHPWTSDPLKQWPLEYFRGLARRLAEELKLKVIIVGGKEEREAGLKYFEGISPLVLNLTGKTTLVELGALLANCRLLVSGDSGPVHLASCVGTPVVAIFRNDLPGKGPVRWGPASAGSIVVAGPSLEEISVNEVFIKAKEALKL
ncbi:MAG: glycosyltransferase family 9 protein [Candidatus Omnitrophica bacterium]|nr:glycosyltransferase family 9 protein [Candidatus Omnitrophota bacterium]